VRQTAIWGVRRQRVKEKIFNTSFDIYNNCLIKCFIVPVGNLFCRYTNNSSSNIKIFIFYNLISNSYN